MPRRPGHTPALKLHKPSGQARVIIQGKHIYLGRYGSQESQEKYGRLITQLAAGKTDTDMEPEACLKTLTVSDLILEYLKFAQGHYDRGGQLAKEYTCMKDALRPLRRMYGSTGANEFSPMKLADLREHMRQRGWSRGVINHQISRVKRIFKWGAEREKIPASVYTALQVVKGLSRGYTKARETEPVEPVPDDHARAVLPFVAPQIATMIQIQRMTGMRPGEVVIMRGCDIDMSGETWIYEPVKHKTSYLSHQRLVPLGRPAQTLLKPFLNRPPHEYLFSPEEAEAWRRERRPIHYRPDRKTPVYPSELKAREKAKRDRRKRTPKRPKGERYTTDSYRRAINYGFVKARKSGVEIPHWHPHQLRHAFGTEVREQHGIDAAQVALGHHRVEATQIYAKPKPQLAIDVARNMTNVLMD